MKRFPVGPDNPLPPLWENYPFQSVFVAVFEKGEFLCIQDQPLEYIFLLQSGKGRVCILGPDGKNLLINFYSKGSLIGDVEAILLQPEAVVSIQAINRVTCYAVPIEEFVKTAEITPELMNHMAILLAGRAKRSIRNTSVNILSTLETRLCAYIRQMQHDGFFEENLAALSDMLGTSYRHLFRTLRSLCEKGILQKNGHSYQILDMEALSKAAGGMYRIAP